MNEKRPNLLELHKFMHVIFVSAYIAPRIRGFPKVFAEDGDLLHTPIHKYSHSIVFDLQDHADFIFVPAATYNLYVIPLSEALTQSFHGHVHNLTSQVAFRHLDRDDVARDSFRSPNNAFLFAGVDFDLVPGQITSISCVVAQTVS